MTAPSTPITFRAAAEQVLGTAGAPLTASVITERAITAGLLATGGKTPAATMESQLATSIQQHGDASPFIRVAPSTYALRRWVQEGLLAAPEAAGEDVRIVFFPEYASVRIVLPVFVGMTRAQVTGLRAAIWEHRGTFEENADWSDPDTWIPERLVGEHRDVALRIWTGTEKLVNPRHMQGHWLLASGYDLLSDGPGGQLTLTAGGRDFLDQPEGATVRTVDDREGLLALLAMLAEQGPAASGALLAPWLEYVRRVSRIRADTTARSFLYHRLRNLLGRDYAARVGQKYEITAAGLAWLKASAFAERKTIAPDETRRLWDLVQTQRDAVRKGLREKLAAMEPYAFEQLVGRLLEEMDYTDVEVTARSGDKGVDVVGRIALGITEVREVIQVKRQQGNVQRPVLDMLRGSLHRFGAVKGTIISLGGFAKGAQSAAFEPGAAPITLIDGEKLLDLLIENGIGVRTKTVEMLELDETDLVVADDASNDISA
jgi:restriction system protein